MLKIIAKCKPLLLSINVNQLVAGLLGAIIVLLVAVHFMEPRPAPIATVDITGIVNQFVRSQAKLNLPAKALQQRVNTFGHQLQTTLNVVAQKHHVILVVQEAIVAGAPDLTPVVKQQLSQTFNQ